MILKDLKKILESINCFYGKTSENIFKTLYVTPAHIIAENQYSKIMLDNNIFKTDKSFSFDVEQTLNLIKTFDKKDTILNAVNTQESTISFTTQNVKITHKVDFKPSELNQISYSEANFVCSVFGEDLLKTFDYVSSICNLEEFDNLFIVDKKLSAISTFYSLILNSTSDCLSTNGKTTTFSLKYEFIRHFLKISSVLQIDQSVFEIYKVGASIVFVVKNIGETQKLVIQCDSSFNDYSQQLELIRTSILNKLKTIEHIAEFGTTGFTYMCGKIFKATKGIDRGTNLIISNKKIFIKVQNEDTELSMQDIYVDSISYTKKFENFYLNQPYNNSAFYKFIRSFKEKTINLYVFEENFVNYYVFGNVVDNITIFQK